MNKKLLSIPLVLALIAVSSCKKFLEISPQQTFTSEIATASLSGLTKTVTGAFSTLTSANLYGGGIIANSELMADFVTADPIADYSLNQFRTRQLDPYNSQSGGMWDDAYKAIYIVNVVLQSLPNFQAQNPGQCQLLKGECLLIRGAMHFELLRMFAQPSGYTTGDSHLGVPLQLLPGAVNTGQSVPRSTVAQCYAQIESDLFVAAQLLPATSGPSGQTFATQGAAQGFLTRVYFTQHNYQQALMEADSVIGLAGYGFGLCQLNATVGAIDSVSSVASSSPETIFQVISTPTTYYANNVLINRFRVLALTAAQCYMSQAFTPYFQSDSAAGGYRTAGYAPLYPELYTLSSVDGPNYYYCNKYNQIGMNMTVIRLAEILLTRAECNIQLGNSTSSVLSDLNLIRTRAGLLPDNTTNNPTALLNEVRAQRDLELAVEGDRFFEIKRRQISFASPESGQVFQWNSPQLVYPIPLQEVQENKNMVQNPGY